MISISDVCKHSLLLIVYEGDNSTLLRSKNGYTLYVPINNTLARIDRLKGTFGISILITEFPSFSLISIIRELSNNHNISLFIPDPKLMKRVSCYLNLECLIFPSIGTPLPINSWTMVFFELTENGILDELDTQLSIQYKEQSIYPQPQQIFSAFDLTPIDHIKVLILGQDPYVKRGEAHGLAFSSLIKIPPSLRTVYRELNRTGFNIDDRDGNLSDWANQGVLLLNTALTVQEAKPKSHSVIWSRFTSVVLESINRMRDHIIVMLWGKDAEEFEILFDKRKHVILKCGHPSPLNTSNPFIGCDHFRLANSQLKRWGLDEIKW